MRKVLYRGVQGLGIGLAALVLTGLLHLLEPACLIPGLPLSEETSALPIGCLPENTPSSFLDTLCALSEPDSCCLEAHRIFWTSRPSPNSCCHASFPLKALLQTTPQRLIQHQPAASPLMHRRRAASPARYLAYAVLRL